MPARRPLSSDATTTTVVIPMTIPMTVSMERKRCTQTASMAIARFSLGDIFTLTYSALSATIGSSFDAFSAGYQPLTIPTVADTITESKT